MSSKLMNVEEAAKYLGVSKQWVYDHSSRKEPKIPCVKIGNNVRFRPESLTQWVESREQRVA
jgi:excisionase family DNA binding protein